jgi:hypothetical protein
MARARICATCTWSARTSASVAIPASRRCSIRRSVGGPLLSHAHQDTAVCLRHPDAQRGGHVAFADLGEFRPDGGRADGGRRPKAVEQRLLDRHRRAEVGQRVGMIEGIQAEVVLGKASLCQQRAEHEYGLIPFLP